MCTRPLKGFKYGKTEKGKDNYVIRSYSVDHIEIDSSGNIIDCLSPVGFIHGRTIREFIEIPCGKCLDCRLEYSRQWADRCFLESLKYKDNCFVTLTYNDDNLPCVEVDGDIYKTLVKSDLQEFIKALRNKLNYNPDTGSYYKEGDEEFVKIRYFASGEYGSKARPHYHLIIFNWNPANIVDDLVPVGKNNLNQFLYSSQLLSKIWNKGFNVVAECTWESCSYVARYVAKKLGNYNQDIYDQMNIEKEFVIMSRRPGIGSDWFDVNKKCYATFSSQYIPTKDGSRQITHNKYFDKKLQEADPDSYEEVKKIRKEFIGYRKRLESKTTSLPYLEILKVKEENLTRKTKALLRKEN